MKGYEIKNLILEANYSSARVRRPLTPAQFVDILADDRKFDNYVNTFIAGASMTPSVANEFRVIAKNVRRHLLEQAVTQNVSYYETLTFPILSVFYPRLIAREMVTVTPISKPEVIKAFLVPKFYKGNTAYTAPVYAADVSRGPSGNSVYTATFGANQTINLFTVAQPQPIPTPATIQRGTLSIVQIENTTNNQNMTVNIYPTVDGTFEAVLDLSSINGPSNATLTGTVNYKSGIMTVSIIDNNGPVGNLNITASFVLGFEHNLNSPELQFEIEKIRLVATDRQITARWSLQFEQDVRALYDLDLQSQLVAVIGEQIALDIDREIINHLDSIVSGLPTNSGHTHVFYLTPPTSFTFGPKEWYKNIVLSLERLAATIYRDTNIQAGSLIAVNPNDVNIFTALDDFTFTYESNYMNAGIGFAEATVAGGKFKVLVSPIVPQGKILMTYKPDLEAKVVYYYCPYIPAIIHPYPLSNVPAISFLTRYAVAPIRPLGLARLDLNTAQPPPNWTP